MKVWNILHYIWYVYFLVTRLLFQVHKVHKVHKVILSYRKIVNIANFSMSGTICDMIRRTYRWQAVVALYNRLLGFDSFETGYSEDLINGSRVFEKMGQCFRVISLKHLWYCINTFLYWFKNLRFHFPYVNVIVTILTLSRAISDGSTARTSVCCGSFLWQSPVVEAGLAWTRKMIFFL